MKRLLKVLLITAAIVVVFTLCVYVFMRQAKFGALPSGERAERVKSSPNYRNGEFQNLSNTPTLTEGLSYFAVMKEFLFNKSPRNVPDKIIPSMKTDLSEIDPKENIVVWFGHSALFIQLDGKRFLVDPALSGAASPVKFTTRSFPGSDIYSPDEIPAVDYLLITHDHWDHLDYETALHLKSKVNKIVTGLGTGAHFESWGYSDSTIIEKDWNERVVLDSGFAITVTPARHFSGRGLTRNQALWVSFVIQTPRWKIYISGDTGYDAHFKKIGEEFGPFDIVFLECGQYDKNWKYIHMMPEQTAQAASDLKAKRLMPVHWSKFALSLHAWDEPIMRVVEAGKKIDLPVVHPMIGETVKLDSAQTFSEWWRE